MSKKVEIIISAKNGLKKGLDSVGSTLRSFGSGIGGLFKSAGVAIAGVVASLTAAAIKAADFNKQMAQVATLTDLPFEKITKEARQMSAEFGIAKDAIAKGLYDALSAGVPKENVFDFVRTASKAAIAGGTDTAKAVDFLTSAMNSYAVPAEKAGRMSDILFKTILQGKTTLEELSSSFGRVGALAAGAGVSFEQLMAGIATLTLQGTKTAEAMTETKAALVAFNAILPEGWANTYTLAEASEELMKMAGGSQKELKDLVKSIEAANFITKTAAGDGEKYATILDSITNSAGAMNEAFEKTQQYSVLDRLKQAFSNLIVVAGDRTLELLGPVLERASTAMANLAERAANWAANDKLKEAKETIEGIVIAIGKGGDTRREAFTALAELVKAAFAVAAENVGQTLMEYAPKVGKMIGVAIKDAFFGGGYGKDALDQARAEQGIESPGFFSGPGHEGHLQNMNEQLRQTIELRAKQIELERIYQEAGLGTVAVVDGKTMAEAKYEAALQKVINLGTGVLELEEAIEEVNTRAIETTEEKAEVLVGAAQRIAHAKQMAAEATVESADDVVEAEEKVKEAVLERVQEIIDAEWTQLNEHEVVIDGYIFHLYEVLDAYDEYLARIRAVREEEISLAQQAAAAAAIAGGGGVSPISASRSPRATGGFFESSGVNAQAIQQLRARGALPPNGSVLNPLGPDYQAMIYNEIRTIRQQNGTLLTWS